MAGFALQLPERPAIPHDADGWDDMTVRDLVGLVGWVANQPRNPDRQHPGMSEVADGLLICLAELVAVSDGQLSASHCFGGMTTATNEGYVDRDDYQSKRDFLSIVARRLPAGSTTLRFVQSYDGLLYAAHETPSAMDIAWGTLKQTFLQFGEFGKGIADGLGGGGGLGGIGDTLGSLLKWSIILLAAAYVLPPLLRAGTQTYTDVERIRRDARAPSSAAPGSSS